MDKPDAEAVRGWLTRNDGSVIFDLARVGYGPPPDGQADALERIVTRAVSYVESMTTRQLDDTLPDDLAPIAEDAVTMRTIQMLALRGSSKAVRDALSIANVANMRAGDFSVTFRELGQRAGRGWGDSTIRLNTWDELNDALVLLLTPERRAQLLAEISGTSVPAMLTVERGGYDDWGAFDVYGYWP